MRLLLWLCWQLDSCYLGAISQRRCLVLLLLMVLLVLGGGRGNCTWIKFCFGVLLLLATAQPMMMMMVVLQLKMMIMMCLLLWLLCSLLLGIWGTILVLFGASGLRRRSRVVLFCFCSSFTLLLRTDSVCCRQQSRRSSSGGHPNEMTHPLFITVHLLFKVSIINWKISNSNRYHQATHGRQVATSS